MDIFLNKKDKHILDSKPNISIKNTIDNYSIIIYDPDAPNGVNDDDNHGYLHYWASDHNEYFPFTPPNPSKAVHRYYIALYKHKDNLEKLPKNRYPFDINFWTKYYDMKLIEEKVYFRSSI